MTMTEEGHSHPFFAGRVAVIATMHRKEQAIAPLVEAHLGVSVLVPQGFDTDLFGTFTGDIHRPDHALTTAHLKAAAALDLTGETLAIASEGSFGPHPQIPFLACDRELVLWLDRRHQLEIVAEYLSTDTNYRHQTIRDLEAALAFAQTVGFPSHGLVVKPQGSGPWVKGIVSEAQLVEVVTAALRQAPQGEVRLETDMRALYNPTRMAVIAQATENLVATLQRYCPQCQYPGFALAQSLPGLPCGLCGSPTLLTRSWVYQCHHCQYEQRQPAVTASATADPSYCSYCNP
ncbi:MAG: DUF6671 family protein [Nodosilinea sp.]